jgi:hypothetical protein
MGMLYGGFAGRLPNRIGGQACSFFYSFLRVMVEKMSPIARLNLYAPAAAKSTGGIG